ncbi:MAG: hypothetical protein AAF567_21965 [Actinomycetota bacterium]
MSFERPAPDIDKIATAWKTWVARGADVLPGRTMADLKIGGADHVIETLVEENQDSTEIAELGATWLNWERGRVGPAETLQAITELGWGDIVDQLAEPT